MSRETSRMTPSTPVRSPQPQTAPEGRPGRGRPHGRTRRPRRRRGRRRRGRTGRPPYVNPLVRNRADPHIHRHTDGYYYFTATAPEYDRIILRRSRTLRGLATRRRVRDLDASTPAATWARTSGRRRSTTSTASGTSTSPPRPPSDIWEIRIWVLENASRRPLRGDLGREGPDQDGLGDLLPRRHHLHPPAAPATSPGRSTSPAWTTTPASGCPRWPTRWTLTGPRSGSPHRSTTGRPSATRSTRARRSSSATAGSS